MYEKVVILEKAGEVFGEKGFYLTTIDEIAVRANLKKSILSKYYKNKDELFLELLTIANASRKQEVFDTIGLTDDLRERLSRFIISLLRFARHQRNYQSKLQRKIRSCGKNWRRLTRNSKPRFIKFCKTGFARAVFGWSIPWWQRLFWGN